MNCETAQGLLHALLDHELDAGHARAVEDHLAGCPHCAALFVEMRSLKDGITAADLHLRAPAELRRRIEASLPARSMPANRKAVSDRRSLLKGFAVGSLFSGAVATSVLLVLERTQYDEHGLGDLISAHLRSLQNARLLDVETGDQHTVKPWFNGKVDVAPPVIDLTAKGFTLLGGRLDYLDGKAVAAVVYKRRRHIINLFVEPAVRSGRGGSGLATMQGFNVQRWSDDGIDFLAVSDIAADELIQFADEFLAAAKEQRSVGSGAGSG